jgi:uncharacterized damage-inducible protein DinB
VFYLYNEYRRINGVSYCMAQNHPIANDNITLINQLSACIAILSRAQYQQINYDLNSGSIGAHVRHIIEHYQALFAEPHNINYDARKRDPHIEKEPDIALKALSNIIKQLKQTSDDAECWVKCATNLSDDNPPVVSSISRELTFLFSHTTHHMAIIRILALAQALAIPDGFGKAASTQRFEANQVKQHKQETHV